MQDPLTKNKISHIFKNTKYITKDLGSEEFLSYLNFKISRIFFSSEKKTSQTNTRIVQKKQ